MQGFGTELSLQTAWYKHELLLLRKGQLVMWFSASTPEKRKEVPTQPPRAGSQQQQCEGSLILPRCRAHSFCSFSITDPPGISPPFDHHFPASPWTLIHTQQQPDGAQIAFGWNCSLWAWGRFFPTHNKPCRDKYNSKNLLVENGKQIPLLSFWSENFP